MKTNPYAKDDNSDTTEYLRLALAFLTKHKLAASPFHFRIAYDCVAGRNEELKTALDRESDRVNGALPEAVWDLYRQFYMQDEAGLEKIREELVQVIANIQIELNDSGGNVSKFGEILNRFACIIGSPVQTHQISTEVQRAIKETRDIEQSQQRSQGNMSEIVSEVESLRKELEQVREESLTDVLTGVGNRKAFDTMMGGCVGAVNEEGGKYCVLLGDIDHFKKFNDTFGHLVGDKVLRFVASTLKKSTKGRDMVARYGGEEFAVILPDTDIGGAEAVAEQIRKAISSGQLIDKNRHENYGKITISIGVTRIGVGELPEDVLKRADKALYRAKNLGRNRIEKAG